MASGFAPFRADPEEGNRSTTHLAPTLMRRRTFPPLGLAIAVILGGAALSACGGGTSGGSAKPTGATKSTNTIVIDNFAYQPSSDVVSPGEKITVVNKDSVTHTLTALSGAFNTGDISPGASASLTAPSKKGTYPYRCTIHQYMTGSLIVR